MSELKVKTCGLPKCDGYEPCAVCEFDSFEPGAIADGLVMLADRAKRNNDQRANEIGGLASDFDVAFEVCLNAGRGAGGDAFGETTIMELAIKLARSMRTTEHDVRNAITPLAMHDDADVRACALRVVDLLHTSTTPQTFDLVAHLERQRAFSERTFGPGERTDGVLDHITKEIAEVRAKPHDLTEWIDLVLLALDGAWRHGFTPQQIADALAAKQAKNEARTWPDWRTAELGKAIEHVRTDNATEDDNYTPGSMASDQHADGTLKAFEPVRVAVPKSLTDTAPTYGEVIKAEIDRRAGDVVSVLNVDGVALPQPNCVCGHPAEAHGSAVCVCVKFTPLARAVRTEAGEIKGDCPCACGHAFSTHDIMAGCMFRVEDPNNSPIGSTYCTCTRFNEVVDAVPVKSPADVCECGHPADEHSAIVGCLVRVDDVDPDGFCECKIYSGWPEPGGKVALRVYVATGIANVRQARDVIARVKEAGHVITYDWTQHVDEEPFTDERAQEVAMYEVGAVISADVVIVILPGARGTHTELGMAIASPRCRAIILTGHDESALRVDGVVCPFYLYPRKITTTWAPSHPLGGVDGEAWLMQIADVLAKL